MEDDSHTVGNRETSEVLSEVNLNQVKLHSQGDSTRTKSSKVKSITKIKLKFHKVKREKQSRERFISMLNTSASHSTPHEGNHLTETQNESDQGKVNDNYPVIVKGNWAEEGNQDITMTPREINPGVFKFTDQEYDDHFAK